MESLLPSCGALSSPTICRFIPALPSPVFPSFHPGALVPGFSFISIIRESSRNPVPPAAKIAPLRTKDTSVAPQRKNARNSSEAPIQLPAARMPNAMLVDLTVFCEDRCGCRRSPTNIVEINAIVATATMVRRMAPENLKLHRISMHIIAEFTIITDTTLATNGIVPRKYGKTRQPERMHL